MIGIACIDINNGIGKNGNLLYSIPEDMKFFRETTSNNIIIMGRKTLDSFKNKMPLKNRINIVFTNKAIDLKSNIKYKDIDNIYFIKDKTELYKILNKYKEKKAFVIGGESIYKLLIDECDTLLITKIYYSFDADTFFSDFTKKGFQLYKQSKIYTCNNISYSFNTYT